MAAAVKQALTHLDITDSRAVALVTKLIEAVVARYAPAAATLAIRHYMAERAAAGITSRYTPIPAPMPTADEVQAAVEWAVRRQITPEPDAEALGKDVVQSVQKMVHDTARNTVINNVKRDRQTSAWFRQTHPDASKTGTCAFCAMLASRGAVYTSDSAEFQAHPGCNCTAMPVFPGYEPSAQVQEWQNLWADVTKGRSGADARAAFRQAIEGRPITGLTRGPNAPKRNRTATRPTRPAQPTAEQAQHMIALFEQSNQRAADNPDLAGMVAANNARIAELRQIFAQPL